MDVNNPDASPPGQIFLGTDFLMLFCIINSKFQNPDPDGYFLQQNLRLILHYKMSQ